MIPAQQELDKLTAQDILGDKYSLNKLIEMEGKRKEEIARGYR